MRTLLICALLLTACSVDVDIGHTSQGIHSWSVYHWSSDNRDLSVYDNTKESSWSPFLAQSLVDWNSIDTPLSLTEGPSIPKGGRGADIVASSKRSPSWLGLAQIFLDADGHITAGKVTMNPILLTASDYSDNAAQHVFCQEIGHVLGLHHILGDTCMDDCSWAWADRSEWLACLNSPSSTGPNPHDEEQLNLIYTHVDSIDAVPDAGLPDAGLPDAESDAGSTCRNPRNPHCSTGTWITIHVTPIRH